MLSIEERFWGTWELLSWYMEDGDGQRMHPFGENPTGYIIYTREGMVSVNMMQPGRPALGVPSNQARELRTLYAAGETDSVGPQHLETLGLYFQAAAGYLAYCGTFDVIGDTVVHHLDTALYPEWVGDDQVRQYVFEDDVLVMCTELGSLEVVLRWRRRF